MAGMEDTVNQFIADLFPSGTKYTPSTDANPNAQHGALGSGTYASGASLPSIGAQPKPQSPVPILPNPSGDEQALAGLNIDGDNAPRQKVAANAGNTQDYDATIALQKELNAKGAGLAVDGINGPLTQAAMAKFGAANAPSGPVYNNMEQESAIAEGQNLAPQMQQPEVAVPNNVVGGDPFTENDNVPQPVPTPTASISGGSQVPTNDQAPLEWLLNQAGSGVDYIDDQLAAGAGGANNFLRQFTQRPGAQLDRQIADQDQATKNYQGAYNGQIGSALYNWLARQTAK
jgi:hypothetical protein